jgi:hypothetical protein
MLSSRHFTCHWMLSHQPRLSLFIELKECAGNIGLPIFFGFVQQSEPFGLPFELLLVDILEPRQPNDTGDTVWEATGLHRVQWARQMQIQ